MLNALLTCIRLTVKVVLWRQQKLYSAEKSWLASFRQLSKLLITVIVIRERRRINLKLSLINKIAKYFNLTYALKVNSFFIIRCLILSWKILPVSFIYYGFLITDQVHNKIAFFQDSWTRVITHDIKCHENRFWACV